MRGNAFRSSHPAISQFQYVRTDPHYTAKGCCQVKGVTQELFNYRYIESYIWCGKLFHIPNDRERGWLHKIRENTQNKSFLTSQQFSWFSNKVRVSLLIHRSAKIFLTRGHVLNITAFCITIYRAGRKLSSVKLLYNLFGIIPTVDRTGGIMSAVFNCHILASSSVKFAYFWSLSVMVLWRLRLLGITENLSMVFLWFCQV